MHPEDFTQLPPRYNGTAEQVAPIDTQMPNAMTVEGYIAGLGRMALATTKPGKGHESGRLFIGLVATSLILGAVLGFIETIRTAFG